MAKGREPSALERSERYLQKRFPSRDGGDGECLSPTPSPSSPLFRRRTDRNVTQPTLPSMARRPPLPRSPGSATTESLSANVLSTEVVSSSLSRWEATGARSENGRERVTKSLDPSSLSRRELTYFVAAAKGADENPSDSAEKWTVEKQKAAGEARKPPTTTTRSASPALSSGSSSSFSSTGNGRGFSSSSPISLSLSVSLAGDKEIELPEAPSLSSIEGHIAAALALLEKGKPATVEHAGEALLPLLPATAETLISRFAARQDAVAVGGEEQKANEGGEVERLVRSTWSSIEVFVEAAVHSVKKLRKELSAKRRSASAAKEEGARLVKALRRVEKELVAVLLREREDTPFAAQKGERQKRKVRAEDGDGDGDAREKASHSLEHSTALSTSSLSSHNGEVEVAGASPTLGSTASENKQPEEGAILDMFRLPSHLPPPPGKPLSSTAPSSLLSSSLPSSFSCGGRESVGRSPASSRDPSVCRQSDASSSFSSPFGDQPLTSSIAGDNEGLTPTFIDLPELLRGMEPEVGDGLQAIVEGVHSMMRRYCLSFEVERRLRSAMEERRQKEALMQSETAALSQKLEACEALLRQEQAKSDESRQGVVRVKGELSRLKEVLEGKDSQIVALESTIQTLERKNKGREKRQRDILLEKEEEIRRLRESILEKEETLTPRPSLESLPSSAQKALESLDSETLSTEEYRRSAGVRRWRDDGSLSTSEIVYRLLSRLSEAEERAKGFERRAISAEEQLEAIEERERARLAAEKGRQEKKDKESSKKKHQPVTELEKRMLTLTSADLKALFDDGCELREPFRGFLSVYLQQRLGLLPESVNWELQKVKAVIERIFEERKGKIPDRKAQ